MKVRRKRVNWYDLLFEFDDPSLYLESLLVRQSNKKLSNNRIAYLSFRRMFSKQKIFLIRQEYGV